MCADFFFNILLCLGYFTFWTLYLYFLKCLGWIRFLLWQLFKILYLVLTKLNMFSKILFFFARVSVCLLIRKSNNILIIFFKPVGNFVYKTKTSSVLYLCKNQRLHNIFLFELIINMLCLVRKNITLMKHYYNSAANRKT